MWAKGNRAAERGLPEGRFPPDVLVQEEEVMQRTLLTLALIAAAGTALAQTTTPPASSGGSVTTPSATTPSTSTGGAATPGINQPSPTSDTNTANATPRLTGQAGIAQKRIEADGYKNVQGLAQGSDGLWHGRAMRGNAEVQVTVDKQGNVAQQ
jgi:hypothetical protein